MYAVMCWIIHSSPGLVLIFKFDGSRFKTRHNEYKLKNHYWCDYRNIELGSARSRLTKLKRLILFKDSISSWITTDLHLIRQLLSELGRVVLTRHHIALTLFLQIISNSNKEFKHLKYIEKSQIWWFCRIILQSMRLAAGSDSL